MPKRVDRRRKSRSYCLLVVRYRVRDDAAGEWRAASVLDLTERGCRLKVGEQPAPGAELELRFEALLHDGVKSATIEAPARVMWCRPGAQSSSEIGVQFAAAPAGLSEIRRALLALH